MVFKTNQWRLGNKLQIGSSFIHFQNYEDLHFKGMIADFRMYTNAIDNYVLFHSLYEYSGVLLSSESMKLSDIGSAYPLFTPCTRRDERTAVTTTTAVTEVARCEQGSMSACQSTNSYATVYGGPIVGLTNFGDGLLSIMLSVADVKLEVYSIVSKDEEWGQQRLEQQGQ